MSIETDINRIATALEELVKIGRGQAPVAAVQTTPAPKVAPRPPAPAGGAATLGKGQAVKPAAVTPATPAPAALDPLTGEPMGTPETPTQDQVHAALEVYMEKNGVEGPAGVKALMIKHGALKTKPTITSIPPANYAALIAEASA